MSSNAQQPDKDPFQILRISFEASDAEINKAYRKLALKLHPDKQQDASEAQRAAVAREFHDVQQARAFLLDAEFASARAKYKSKLASQRLRRAADEARHKTMSVNRKRMRDELQRQEAQANQGMGNQRKMKKEADMVKDLQKEGSKLREEFANRAAHENLVKESQRKANKEQRQVRLKWSRKKIGISPSDDSLAKLLQQFGTVEQVEMLGSKGNSALVTFKDAISVSPCVKFYKESEDMRASYVGDHKEREEDKSEVRAASDISRSATDGRDTESFAEWKYRREAEREKLLRQMEAEELGIEQDADSASKRPHAQRRTKLPPPFPSDYGDLEPLQKLEKAEAVILSGILPENVWKELKILDSNHLGDKISS